MKKVLSYILAVVAVFALALPAFAELQTTPELDVEGVKATPLNASVKLEWTPLSYSDGELKGYVVWYDTVAAAENGDAYSNRVPATGDIGNVNTYTVTGLENGKQYYFAVTAVDKNGVESKNWSVPANITSTPSADAATPADDKSPQVTKATAVNKEEVKVEFSEEVVLPVEHPEDAFVVQNTTSFEDLVVKGAVMDLLDLTNKTVIVTTDAQEKDADYKLTVGIDVEDKSGNPILSDTSATAPFKGSDLEKVAADVAGPEVSSVEVIDGTHLMVNFNESVVLGVENFSIVEKDVPANKLNITEVITGKNTAGVEEASAVVTTDAHKDVTYVLTVTGVKDTAGNAVNAEKASAEFKGIVAAVGGDGETPVTAPKDVASFLAKKILEAEKYNVNLTWKIPAENVGKTVEQLLYKSLDKGKEYTKEASLEPAVEAYELKGLDPGEYWFKLTQKDAAGAESKGTIVKVVLSKTGPGVVGLVLISSVLGRMVTKKKKK